MCFFMHLDVFVMGKISIKKTARWKQIPSKIQHKVVTKQMNHSQVIKVVNIG